MTTEPLRKFDGTPDPEILKEYPEITGSLTWLASRSRPDIALAASKLSRYVSNPGPQHLTAARRVLRYLKGTINYGIRLSASDSLDLKLYADAAFADDPDTSWSTAGYCLLAAGGPIFAKSGRQKIVCTSTTDAEFINLTPAVKAAENVIGLLHELGYQGTDLRPLRVYNDNANAISYANGRSYNGSSRTLRIKYHFINEQVQNGAVTVGYVPTADMVADGLTKPLDAVKFKRFRDLLGVTEIQSSLS